MAEIDLIPTDYRNRIVVYGWGRRLFMAMVIFMILSLVIYVALVVANKSLVEDVTLLQNRQQFIVQNRDALREMSERRDRYQRQWDLLKHLRDNTAAARMFGIVDRAISPGDVWFLTWDFRRSGAITEVPSDSDGKGYFIVLSDKKERDPREVWEINIRMTIKGQASDHSALSRFVRRLYEQPEVDDVRILNTSSLNTARIVNFDMVVTVNSEAVTG